MFFGLDQGLDKGHVGIELQRHMVKRVEYLTSKLIDQSLVWLLAILLCDQAHHLVSDGLWVVMHDCAFLLFLQLLELFFLLGCFCLLLVSE